MSELDQEKHTLTAAVVESAIAQDKKDDLVRRIATANTPDDLKVARLLLDAYQLKSPASAHGFIEKYNQHLGIIRISGRAEYLIKDLKEWTGSAPVETWKSSKDARNYLRRLGLKTHEEVLFPGAKKAVRIDCFEEWQGSSAADYYSGITYRPNAPQKMAGQFNLWQGFGTSPRPGDKHLRFLELIRDGFCNGNEAYYAYVIAYLAHMLQKPAERPGTALVIQSGQGAGKGTVIEVLTAMIGEHNSAGDVSTKDLMGGFNSKLAHVLLININEATFSGNHDQVEVMKKLATEPYIRCEYKGYEPFDSPNFARVIITTNNINWGRIDTDDRRYLVLEPSVRFKEDHGFFVQLRKAMFEDGGVEHLMQYLLDLDISEWNSHILPKRCTGLDTLVESMNSDSAMKFFFELAGTGRVEMHDTKSLEHVVITGGEQLPYHVLYETYSQYCRGHSLLVKQGKNRFSRMLNSLGMFVQRSKGDSVVAIPSMKALRKKFDETHLVKWDLNWDVVFDGNPVEPLLLIDDVVPDEPACNKRAAKVLECMKL